MRFAWRSLNGLKELVASFKFKNLQGRFPGESFRGRFPSHALHKNKTVLLYKKKIFFLHKKKFFLHKRRIFVLHNPRLVNQKPRNPNAILTKFGSRSKRSVGSFPFSGILSTILMV